MRPGRLRGRRRSARSGLPGRPPGHETSGGASLSLVLQTIPVSSTTAADHHHRAAAPCRQPSRARRRLVRWTPHSLARSLARTLGRSRARAPFSPTIVFRFYRLCPADFTDCWSCGGVRLGVRPGVGPGVRTLRAVKYPLAGRGRCQFSVIRSSVSRLSPGGSPWYGLVPAQRDPSRCDPARCGPVYSEVVFVYCLGAATTMAYRLLRAGGTPARSVAKLTSLTPDLSADLGSPRAAPRNRPVTRRARERAAVIAASTARRGVGL